MTWFGKRKARSALGAGFGAGALAILCWLVMTPLIGSGGVPVYVALMLVSAGLSALGLTLSLVDVISKPSAVGGAGLVLSASAAFLHAWFWTRALFA